MSWSSHKGNASLQGTSDLVREVGWKQLAMTQGRLVRVVTEEPQVCGDTGRWGTGSPCWFCDPDEAVVPWLFHGPPSAWKASSLKIYRCRKGLTS